jgi:hypothetical protein
MTFEADDRGIVVNLMDQAGVPFKEAGMVYLSLDELRSMYEPIKPHVVPEKRVHFIYKAEAQLAEMVAELERLGMTFTNKGSYDTFDIPHKEPASVDLYYREGQKVQRALCKIAFNYAASQMGQHFMLKDDFDQIRSFVSAGSIPQFPFFFLSPNVPRDLSAIKPDPDQEYHILSVDWDDSPSTIAVAMELFGGRQYKVVLSDNFHGLFRTDLAHAHYFDLRSRNVREMRKGLIIQS